ncbi:MAG: TIGR01458 family HAD-type hydrolase [Gammaproteobacteria bacterium]|nr:TIGR01458 family HAD-type hydrolase [Gammaproteobacteria bacterium]
MHAILLDLDGVLYQGECAVPGAAASIRWLQESGVPHLFVTNTTSRPRRSLVDKLAGFDIDVTADAILTPPVAARQWLQDNVTGDIALFVPEATREEFAGLPLLSEQAQAGAGAVVLGDLAEGWTFTTLNRAFRLLIAEPKPPLVALGMTRYWQAPNGLQLDVAPFVVALEHAAGCSAHILGKPSAEFFVAALRKLGTRATDTVMVGDDIRGDVDAAQQAGLPGILVRTGKFRPSDLQLGILPHATLDSIAALPAWWQANQPGTKPPRCAD